TINTLILASSNWKTVVSMVNLDGYQYLQANSQRKALSERAIFMVLLFLPKATTLQHIFPTPRGIASERVVSQHSVSRAGIHTAHQPGTTEI
ncbi:unnamed protein product, partial [Bubo scandiacus]